MNDRIANPALKLLAELISDIEIAMLTTRTADGSMVARPLQTLNFDGGDELIFFTAAGSAKVKELSANPDVLLTYADPRRRSFLSVRGTASIDRDAATIDALWSPGQRVFFPEGKNDPRLVVLRVRLRDAAWWQPAGNIATQALDFVRGLVSDQAEDLGEHGVVEG